MLFERIFDMASVLLNVIERSYLEIRSITLIDRDSRYSNRGSLEYSDRNVRLSITFNHTIFFLNMDEYHLPSSLSMLLPIYWMCCMDAGGFWMLPSQYYLDFHSFRSDVFRLNTSLKRCIKPWEGPRPCAIKPISFTDRCVSALELKCHYYSFMMLFKPLFELNYILVEIFVDSAFL